jgi:hypothetical protein
MQKNRRRESRYEHGPKQNPAPPDHHRNGIIEHVAMPPFRSAGLRTGTGTPVLETRGANVLRSQLQITQRAHEAAAPLAASLKRLVWMKEACRLVRKRGRSVCGLLDRAPHTDL